MKLNQVLISLLAVALVTGVLLLLSGLFIALAVAVPLLILAALLSKRSDVVLQIRHDDEPPPHP